MNTFTKVMVVVVLLLLVRLTLICIPSTVPSTVPAGIDLIIMGAFCFMMAPFIAQFLRELK